LILRTDLAIFDDFGILSATKEVNLFEKNFRRLSQSADDLILLSPFDLG
jgi:hypothetical protein